MEPEKPIINNSSIVLNEKHHNMNMSLDPFDHRQVRNNKENNNIDKDHHPFLFIISYSLFY